MPTQRRWLAVAAALGFLSVVEALSDSLFDGALPFPFDTLVVVGVFTIVGIAAARLAFRTIDRLTADVLERNVELESRNEALQAVYDVSLEVSGQADPQRTITSIAEQARRVLRADGALIALDEGEAGLCLRAASPLDLFHGRSCGIDAGSADRLRSIAEFVPDRLTVLAQAPIMRADRPIGSLAIVSKARRNLDGSETRVLEALATQAGIALEAARLHAEIQTLAVQGERERIARDMHDGLAQVLGYVNTKSQAVEGLLEERRYEEARSQAAELSAAARSVYVDVRETILNLSNAGTDGMNLAAALRDYAPRYAESSKLAVRCEISLAAEDVPLPVSVQAEAFRIVREALTNVRKHASANRVVISADVERRPGRAETELVVKVADDGRGFDPDLVGVGPENWPHFGLAGMRERAAVVGGAVEWRSSHGTGTDVVLRLPVVPERRREGEIFIHTIGSVASREAESHPVDRPMGKDAASARSARD